MHHVSCWIDIGVSTLDFVVNCFGIHEDLVQFLSEIQKFSMLSAVTPLVLVVDQCTRYICLVDNQSYMNRELNTWCSNI